MSDRSSTSTRGLPPVAKPRLNPKKGVKLSTDVENIEKVLKTGDVATAYELIRPLVERYPKHPELLYCLAVALRLRGKVSQARDVCERLIDITPRSGRAYQEYGYAWLTLRKPTEARSAFEQAVSFNPGLLASWQRLRGLTSPSAKAALERIDANLAYLESMPLTLRSVVSQRYEKKLRKAEQTCRSYLKENPKHPEAMRLLGLIASEQGMLDDAEFLLESALEFHPDDNRIRISYIDILHKRQKYDKSLAQAITLLDTGPTNQTFRLAHANQLAALGQFEQALTVYDDILENHAGSALATPRLWLSKGHALKTFGKTSHAIDSYRRAAAMREDFGDAYWSLANLKTYVFTDVELTQMTELAGKAGIDQDDLAHLHFALGKAQEDRANYQASFEHYEAGNKIRLKQTGYDAATMTARLKLQRWVCNETFFDERKGVGYSAPDPIFIVGLPRAGSTLLEQILASHSQVDGTLELHNVSSFAQKLDSRRRRADAPRYPGTLSHLKLETFETIGKQYIDETQIHRQGAPYFIDKMPNNFRHIGLIQLILPNAKIIDARREPMSGCFSCFKQLFASGQEFTYGLHEIGTYYQDYLELMQHWDAVLPNRVLRVHYEDVVNDLETQVKRMLDYCELPFESACVDFHKNRRAVRTPSAEQVRQPIFTEGLEYWKNYDKWLSPLREALGPALWSFHN